ncbi:hypothetical protein SASPL_111894 [Salvia splendens]|uniref:Small ribosomal subunit protein uS3 C-terminal domain-containing protein n=1 Tax=Salvia splendens TaxID=180675 RepID=A0A8X9A425_SALSN|nr:hypothetical protein SASPL_111894 [Salvia splendens]
MAATQMSKKRKFVANGVFFVELNEVLTRELAEDGYSGVELYDEKVNNKGLYAIAQAESLRYKLLGGLAGSACKVQKFKDGYMISSGQPIKEYIDYAVRHVLLSQGVLGIKVKIMLDWDPKGKLGPVTPLPDIVIIHPPKEEEAFRPALAPAEVEVEV